MRRLLSFACEGCSLGGTLDDAAGRLGLLIVTGGSQTRIGSHRMFERLAAALAAQGVPCFRFDRRGVGDSEGQDPDFEGNAADIAAAAAAFRAAAPQVERMIGFGLCDGATSLALFGAGAGLDGLILVNPWFVEAEANAPAAAAIKHHYRKQLLSIEGWKKILSGSISYGKLMKGVMKVARGSGPGGLAERCADGLAAAGLPLQLMLASDDATAVAAADVWRSKSFAAKIRRLPQHVTSVATDSHTFARPGDAQSLLDACSAAIARLSGSGRD